MRQNLSRAFFIVWVLCLWNSTLEAVHWQGPSVGYGSTNNRLRIRERVEWMVCHSDCISSSEATTCNHQFSESEWLGFFTKRIRMYHFGKFANISNVSINTNLVSKFLALKNRWGEHWNSRDIAPTTHSVSSYWLILALIIII